MKIGIDARMFGPKQGGIGRYVQQLILNLEKLPNLNVDFFIFLRQENWQEYQPANPRFKKILADIPWYSLKEQFIFPNIIKKTKIDLMHFPHWNVPFFYNRPFIVTIHDLLLLHYPTRAASTLGPITYFFKQLGFKAVLRHAAHRARQIITVSEYSRQDIVSTLGIDQAKIHVTYPAPFPAPADSHLEPLPRALKPKKYLLYVGVAFPHKNLDGLLHAWKLFTSEDTNDYQLVLVGKNNYFYDHAKKLNTKLANKNVIFADFVPDHLLPTIYKNAAAFVFPSFYEGFGIPPLEAMSYNIPVISSDQTCLPEVLKNAAHYFDPNQPKEIVKAINLVFNDQNLRQKLVLAGQKLYPQYSWKKLAQGTWEIYQNSV